ncbi:hypothetical protein [Rarobacter faecitabidus]
MEASRILMNYRQLVAYFVRYGLILWLIPIQLGVSLIVALQRGAPWRGDIIWTLDWLGVALTLIAPLVAGIAAVDAARLLGNVSYLEGNRISRTPHIALVSAYGLAVTALQVFTLLVAVLVSHPSSLPVNALLVALNQSLVLIVMVSLGSLAGRLGGSVFGGILAVLAGAVVMFTFGYSDTYLSPFDYGGATVPRVGYIYNTTTLLAQTAMLALLTVALSMTRLTKRGPRRALRLADAGGIAGILVAVMVIVLVAPAERLSPSDERPTTCGAAATIPTCFYPEHRRVASAYTEQFWVLATAAMDKGYPAFLPTQVVEASQTYHPRAQDPSVGEFIVSPEGLAGETPTLWEIALGVLEPGHCAQLQTDIPPSQRYADDLYSLIGTWLHLVDPSEAEMAGLVGIKSLSPEEVADLVEAFRTCNYPYFTVESAGQ